MSKKIKINTIIISDVHLGGDFSRTKKIIETLNKYSFYRLILLGDIFDNLDFTELSQDQWDFLSYLTELSKEVKVRWVEGNHDLGLIKITSLLMGIKVYKKYKWQYKKEKYLAIHGHQFDRFIINNAFISFFASFFYKLAQRLDFKNRKIIGYIKNNSKGWLRLSEKVANSAIRFAKLNRVKYIFCGHTHQAMEKEKNGIKYYNSGCWTDIPSSYITIDKKGIEIHEIK